MNIFLSYSYQLLWLQEGYGIKEVDSVTSFTCCKERQCILFCHQK